MRSSITKKKKKSRKINSNKKFNYLIHDFTRVIFLNSISIGLFYIFLNNIWSPLSYSQVQVQGNHYFDQEKVIKASKIVLPKKLLEIIPKRIESNLIQNLSLQAVSVRRQILPTKLIIEIIEREPIAYAQRIGELGIENGMIDKKAQWIPIEWATKNQPDIFLHVTGWEKKYRDSIGFIIQHQQNLGSKLQSIKLNPTGEIILKTEYFQYINLGSNSGQLPNQIKILEHLSKSLPPNFIQQKETAIDLRDLSKPELQTGTLK
tara:strand:+ start:2109 stop:2894 length:786 start_codon:yes stop_codon:yes gene_type:complete